MDNLMFFEGQQVEVFELNGEVYFNPHDIGECLGIPKNVVRTVITRMNDQQLVKLTDSDVQNLDIRKLNNGGEYFLNEKGMFSFVFHIRTDVSGSFIAWAIAEVIPTFQNSGNNMKDSEENRVLILAKGVVLASELLKSYYKAIGFHEKHIDRLYEQLQEAQKKASKKTREFWRFPFLGIVFQNMRWARIVELLLGKRSGTESQL